VEASDMGEALDTFAQILRDPETTENQYTLEIREVQPWEDDEEQPEWFLDVQSLQVYAPTEDDAYRLGKAKLATGETRALIYGAEAV